VGRRRAPGDARPGLAIAPGGTGHTARGGHGASPGAPPYPLIRGAGAAYDPVGMPPRRAPGTAPAALAAWRRRAFARMRRSRAETLALVRRMPAGVLRRPRTQADWSIQDVLAHIAAWEAEGARRLALIARGRGARIVWYDTTAELDRFNARAVRAARRLGPGAVLRRLEEARRRLVAGLRRLPASALADPAHALPVTRWLREFAWTHEAAHRRAIRAWWRGRRAGASR
jgi:hypothetical protein